MKNLFCERSVLTNEASVEQFFVHRLLRQLSYPDSQILPKTSIDEVTVGRGAKKINYKPDFILTNSDNHPRWLIDAKAPAENLDHWVEQCASYCLVINRRLHADGVRYFMLTNGIETRVYDWHSDTPILVMQFTDFVKNSNKLKDLQALLSASALQQWADASQSATVRFEKPTPNLINSVFVQCNNYIYKHDNISPAAAFREFVKIIFLKIRADRELHRKYPDRMLTGEAIPAEDVVFSVAWISKLEGQHSNPLDVQFQELVDFLEKEILRGNKKRIFESGEQLTLQPDTAKAVVRMLERYDLFGIDEDLNGRLFETFLNSTMRGAELGQYFTPRSVVKLMTRLADLRASRNHVDKVMDPCCGTGGFLIESLAVLTRQVDENRSLSGAEKKALLKTIREQALFGIDVGREPPIARIARINMYLHGDGGSRIYVGEALDKDLSNQGRLSPETESEIAELKELLAEGDGFDVIITNPPFAKEYDPKVPSARKILAEYKIANGTQPMRSSVLFFERYYDLLRPGGRVLAVVDDSVLGGKRYADARDFIRSHFIVLAVISLPGDAFQRSGARVKTSVIYLAKRETADNQQPDVFMWYCTAVGVDDSARQRVSPDDAAKREAAKAEVAAVVEAFQAARTGSDHSWLVPAEAIIDRLDVKSCMLKPDRKVEAWKERGLSVGPVKKWVTQRVEVSVAAPEDSVRLLSVRYDGMADIPTELVRETIKYNELYVAKPGDVVVSHINAVNGAICVVPKEYVDVVVSPEYTVLTPKANVDPHALWAMLRSPEIRAEILTRSSGLGRHRIDPELLLELSVPAPIGKAADETRKAFVRALELEEEAKKLREKAQANLEEKLDLRSDSADRILLAFKPPR